MANGHRTQIKRERNAKKDTRPSAKLSYARIPTQKACFVMDAIRGKDVTTAIGILTYNNRYASEVILKLLPLESVRRRVLCLRRPDHEEDQAQGTGQSLQDSQENEQSQDRSRRDEE